MKRTKKTQEHNLVNPANYGPFADIAKGYGFTLYVESINSSNWRAHYNGLLNILRDGIYDEYVQQYMVHVVFQGGEDVYLSIMDLYMNIIMWRLMVITCSPIEPKHIFWEEELTADSIKDYVDKFFISVNRTIANNNEMSNIIADTLHCFHDIDQFSMYLSNTLNLEDSIDLMERDKTYYDCLHTDLSGLAIDTVKEEAMKRTKQSIACIRDSKKLLGYDHCLADAWRANEGISIKQYMEVSVGIATKPDGRGGIFNSIVNTSFFNGGVIDPVDYFIESSVSRISQIIKFKTVSQSGTFARIAGLNNMDSYLNHDPKYDCGTKHLVPIQVKTDKHLKYLNLRYFREIPGGIERVLNYDKDKYLIGRTIYLRDPCTCASAAGGHGVCYKCYGNLAYTVFDSQIKMGVNIGRIASESITAKLTQKQLSVKHILDANITKLTWTPAFYDFFEMEVDIIQLSSQLKDPKNYYIAIDPDAIDSENEAEDSGIDEDSEISQAWVTEYITELNVVSKVTGEAFKISTDQEEKLYLTNEFNQIIRKKAEPIDGMITVPCTDIIEVPLFIIQGQNNEITRTLIKLKHLYNRIQDVRGRTIHDLLQEILDTNIEANMGISAVHYSILLMNQIRDDVEILDNPNWYDLEPHYQILTLNEALNYNPSVLISLSYQKISKQFYTPLTYRKKKASFMDLFFMERPQRLIRDINEKVVTLPPVDEIRNPIIIHEDPNRITSDGSDNYEEFVDNDD